MTWQEDLEKGDLETWMTYQSGAHCHNYDSDDCILMAFLEDALDESGYMWSISRMWYPNSQPYKIMIFIDPDRIIETYAKSRIEALVAGWLALKRVKA